jgi:hypothetical protein
VSWRVILSVRPDQLKNFKLLTREMVEATRQKMAFYPMSGSSPTTGA